MLINFAIAIAVLLCAALAFILTRPDTFRLERKTTIAAPAARVFGLINDFHQWEHWSPWEKLDSKMTKKYEGPSSGRGASYYWSGNSKAGEGRMTIEEERDNAVIKIRLEFIRPFATVNQTTFLLTPVESGTNVSWVMEGRNNFFGKAFSPFMDKTVGGDFERGLANLNRMAQL